MLRTRIAIVGSTGAVGKEMINCIFSEKLPIESLHLFASSKSSGNSVDTPLGRAVIEEFSIARIQQLHCGTVLLAVSGDFSNQFAPQLVDLGCLVIDNSSAFRYKQDVPLIVPELNGVELLEDGNSLSSRGLLIANPNCTTAILAMALYPLHKEFGVRKVICSTYQAASGAGEEGMVELRNAIAHAASKKKFDPKVFSHNLCGNVIPCIDTPQENGYTKEEMKMVWELSKIFNTDSIKVSCTAVRVPTERAHCVSASIEFNRPITTNGAKSILSGAPGVVVKDDMANKVYPLPETASGEFDVEVGRIRQSLVFEKNGIDMFVCGDQLLRGAALNAVRIALLLNRTPIRE